MEKNGSSHLDFILSFTIFILFVVFMYSIIQPAIETPSGKESLLKLLRFDLFDNYYIEDLTTMTIYITLSLDQSKECIKITGGEIHTLFSGGQELTIKDGSGNLLGYGSSGGNLVVGPITSTFDKILKIYYASSLGKGSPVYSESGCGSNNIGQDEYDVSFVKEEKQKIISSKIFKLLDDYNTDCGKTIKQNIGFPSDSNFTFSFLLANGSRIESKKECAKIPDQTSVYAEEFPVQYLNESLNLQVGEMTTRVW